MAAYASSVTLSGRKKGEKLSVHGLACVRGTVDVTNYNATLAEITGITNMFRSGETPIVILGGISDNGYLVAWVAASKSIKAWYPKEGQTLNVTDLVNAGGDSTIDVTDLDAAASTGVALYVHIDEAMEQGSYVGHLEFVSPTDADTTFLVEASGASIAVQDDDLAATGGTVVYFDEDGTDGSRIMFISPSNRDVYIPLSNGEFMHVTDNDDSATDGVQLYLDEDAANAYEKLMFVSPTNVSGDDSAAGAQVTSVAGAAAEVASDVDVGAVEFVAFGRT